MIFIILYDFSSFLKCVSNYLTKKSCVILIDYVQIGIHFVDLTNFVCSTYIDFVFAFKVWLVQPLMESRAESTTRSRTPAEISSTSVSRSAPTATEQSCLSTATPLLNPTTSWRSRSSLGPCRSTGTSDLRGKMKLSIRLSARRLILGIGTKCRYGSMGVWFI